MNLRPFLLMAGLALKLADSSAQAQWIQQSISLRPGWNAVFLEVDPEPSECDALFEGLPVESVWAWNRRGPAAQFIQDPGELIIGQPDWLTYLPPAHRDSGQTSLFALQGGRAYLVRVSDNAAPFSWTLTGKPCLRAPEWVPNSLNFVGFHLRPANVPTFQTYFAGFSSHAGQMAARLTPDGRWENVNLATTAPNPGEAYWVMSAGPSDFNGPVETIAPGRSGIDFGADLVEEELRIVNRSAVARQVTVTPHASSPPPSGASAPPIAGSVPLSRWEMDLSNGNYGWAPFTAPVSRQLAPGEEWRLRLEARRRDMPSPGWRQSHLEVTDSAGGRRFVPVSAVRSAGDFALARGTHAASDENAPHERAGLWVGMATLRAVNQPSRVGDPTTPLPTPAEFQFRLIAHVDAHGEARLLQQVLQMRHPATYKPDPDNPGHQIVDEPSRTVLLTDASLAEQFAGATVRDGRPVGRRVSSVAFPIGAPIPLEGAEFGQGAFTANIVMPHDHRLNPFHHRYHPDHDNLDERFEQTLPDGVESFTVTREVTLEFTATDPENLPQAGWNDTHLGGVYQERISGLHRHPLHVSGVFRLQRVSRVASLNDAR